MPLKILSLNANGLNHPAKRANLWKTASRLSCNVICVQETHFKATDTPRCSHRDFPHIFTSSGPKKTKGVLIALHKSITIQLYNSIIDPLGRYIILVGSFNGLTTTLVALYAPNKRPVHFLNRLMKKISSIKQGSLLLCGDFNVVPDSTMDSNNPSKRQGPDLSSFLRTNSLYDVWRCHHPSNREYTHLSSVHNSYSRLDFFLVDKWLLCKIGASDIESTTWSDHSPISITIPDTLSPPPHKMWRANTFIMKTSPYAEELNSHLSDFFTHNVDSVSDPTTVWLAHKAYIRGILIQMCSRAKKTKSHRIEQITSTLDALHSANSTNPTQAALKQILSLRLELKSLLLDTYEKSSRILKAKFYSTSNRAGKLMARRIHGIRTKSKLPFLIHPTSQEKLTNPQDIAEAFCAYYKKLYNLPEDPETPSPPPASISSFLNNLNLPSLSTAQLHDLNTPITTEEIINTIRTLPSHKSPGPDGLPGEYYKQFQHTLAPHLRSLFNKAITTSSFPDEMLSATIITLPKPGKDPTTPQNFRPISLLNSDLKLYAKILANRIATHLPNLIHTDQSGFTTGRQTSDATRRLTNIIHLTHQSRTPSLLLSLDAEKAFDRVNWTYLSMTLQRFGFQGNILSAILALYKNPSARVYNDKMISHPFKIKNGTRQGCPLSPLIFNLIIEPLAESIRSNPHITGVTVGPIHHKISLFADDIILIITNPLTSLPHIQDALASFGNLSYYKINSSKSHILDLGIDTITRAIISQKYPYPWQDSKISYLGISLPKHTNQLFNTNYLPFKHQFIRELSKLSKIEFSWSGRLAAFKMTLLPKLLYLFRTLPIPLTKKYLNSLQSHLNKYIWQGKKSRAASTILYKHRSIGGANLTNIADYYLATLLSQLKPWWTDSTPPQWLHMESTTIPSEHPVPWLLSLRPGSCLPTSISPTLHAAIKAWWKLSTATWTNTALTRLQIPLSTVRHLIPDFPTSNWESKGIRFINSLLSQGTILPFTSLQERHNLATTDLYRHMQITHCIRHNPYLCASLPTQAFLYLTSSTTSRKGISTFYNLLNEKSTFSKLTPMLKWESDLNCTYSEAHWIKALNSIYKATTCTPLRELSIKIIQRWYLTPEILSKFPQHPSPLCWRGCGNIGTLYHTLWSCPHISDFWRATFNIIDQLTGTSSPLDPALAILNISIDKYPTTTRKIVTHILLAARLNIVRKWKSQSPPTIFDMIQSVHTNFSFEMALSPDKTSYDKLTTLWSPWKRWFAKFTS